MSTVFTRETIEALRRGQTPEGHAAIDQLNLMARLLVESWDALSAVVKTHHLRLHNISPTLVQRIATAIEPWKEGPREEQPR